MSGQVVIATLDGGGAPFLLAATDAGIVAAGWESDATAFADGVGARLRMPTIALADAESDDPAAATLRAAIPTLEALLRGRPANGAAISIDLQDRPAFDQRVLGEVRLVGWGETASYGDIAKRVGAPRAARAVGGALGRNPISLLIPCHRIIAGDGTLGGYGGTGWLDRGRQLSRKEALLLREGVTVRRRDG